MDTVNRPVNRLENKIPFGASGASLMGQGWKTGFLGLLGAACTVLTLHCQASEPGSDDACPASEEEQRRLASPVLAAGQRPWSMAPLPVRPPDPPPVGLAPPHSEERRLLLRRLTFVLTGLPPREDDAHAFLEDPSSRALESALRRLTADATAPQRLGEAWLRATGYIDRWSDSDPGVIQPASEAWRYRDWVVSSLASTPDVRPLARMTLAGDARPATGSTAPNRHSLTATLWHLTTTRLDRDFEESVMEWSGRQAERTVRAFLGIDLSCARCHDHPAVPLPTDQAAGLVAAFAHTQAFVQTSAGVPELNRISTTPVTTTKKRQRDIEAIAELEARLQERREEFALIAAAEFLPQTAEYVRAAWAWHKNPSGSLAAFSATRGLLAEPLGRWLQTLGLEAEAPPHSLTTPWWTHWEAARQSGTPDAIADAARAIQESHRADRNSPFFSTSPAMDAFFTLDQQTQLLRQSEKIDALRKKLPEDIRIPALAEGAPPGMEPPALVPTLPTLLTGGASPTPITPPGAGRRALATWLETEGAPFFARLAAVRLAEALGNPILPPPASLQLWSATRPAEATTVDDIASCLVTGGWPAAARRILTLQATSPTRPPLILGHSEWRDSILFVTGTLDARQGGAPDASPASPRRSLYREWAPIPSPPDSDFLASQATALAALAQRKGGTDPKVQLTFLTHRLFQRAPTATELSRHTGPDTLASLCTELLHSEEFRTFP